MAGADRFDVQQALMPYEHLLPPRFRGRNERIDDVPRARRAATRSRRKQAAAVTRPAATANRDEHRSTAS